MKNIQFILLFLISVFSFSEAGAQVGIGTSSPQAQLDIPATNAAAPTNTDGILIPRVNALPTTNPTALQQGMLIFLTTAVGSNIPGFYYWNNPTTSWISIGSTNNWNLLGNAGTTPTTNFLGTTDDQDLVIKRNNIKAGFIGNPNTTTGNMNTSFGANSLLAPSASGIRNTAIGTNVLPTNGNGNLNVAIGDQAMFSNSTGAENTAVGVGSLYTNSSGTANTAVGRNALTSNSAGGSNTAVGYTALRATTGSFNTAVGRDALRTNGAGADNTAIGVNALYSNISGGSNTAAGVQALRNTTSSNNTGIGWQSAFTNTSGANNTVLGYQSLFTNSTGGNNVALGYQAGYLGTGGNNVFLGYQAGYNDTGSNKLYIENTNANAANALIYGEFDNNIVRVNGQLQVADPAAAGYKFPLARGTNKQVLETDGAGQVSWANPNNGFSVMRANMTANQSLTTSGWQKMNFNTALFDSNTEFGTATGRFTAAKAGYYQINAAYHIFGMNSTQYYSIAVFKNGVEYQETSANHVAGPIFRSINCIVNLAAGDYIEIWAQNYETGSTIDSYSGKTFFEVSQIK